MDESIETNAEGETVAAVVIERDPEELFASGTALKRRKRHRRPYRERLQLQLVAAV